MVSSTSTPTLLTVTVKVPERSAGAVNLGGATGQIGAFCSVNCACVLSDVKTIYRNGTRKTISTSAARAVTSIDGRAFAILFER
jgi:hypothetical protein